MQHPSVSFTPSTAAGAAVTIATPANNRASAGAMPPPDPAAPDTMITVAPAGAEAWIGFAAGAAVGPHAAGCLHVTQDGALLTSDPTISGAALARCTAGPVDPYGLVTAAAIGAAAASAMTLTIRTNPPGSTITITRGTAAAGTRFS